VWGVRDRTERVRMLLGAGMDVSVGVRCREYGPVLHREGVSVVESTRRLVCNSEDEYDREHIAPEYRRVMNEMKYVRRYSV
jgi:hypothetical protein